MHTWTFVRHGQSIANLQGWLAGHTDAPLTDRGRQQAERAGELLADEPFDRAYTSDLSRARETTEIILRRRSIPLHQSPHLRERHCGAWDGHNISSLERRGGMSILRTFDQAPPGGESLKLVARRALAFMATLEPAGRTLLVGHGALIRALIGVMDDTPLDQIGLWKPQNCEIVRRNASPEQLGLWLRRVS